MKQASEAQAAYVALSEEQTSHYEAVKASLLDRVVLSVENYRQKFQLIKGPLYYRKSFLPIQTLLIFLLVKRSRLSFFSL
ncbi:hypothetical protein UY3_00144 [Chelonia mydas]|uniref:Uncharacterized protein n=1 Tax=Chelonia mydas TaxID=8469 RepID=M7BXI5_CHEMY|nr:hypothetical protein UY3_00144 [Chelonia mydas]